MTHTPAEGIEAGHGNLEFPTGSFAQPIVVLLDDRGRILYLNDAWRSFCFGWNEDPDPGAWIGRDFAQVAKRAQVEEGGEGLLVSTAVRDLVAGKRKTFEITYACNRGSRPRWFKMVCRAVGNSPSVRAVIMLVDVTEACLGEQVMRETEARLCDLFEDEGDPAPSRLTDSAIETMLTTAGVGAADGPRANGHNGNGKVRLSPRERECLLWTSYGLRSKEVAGKLGITTKTVEHHLAKAKQKLDSKNRVEAVTRAIALNLIHP